MRTMDRPRGLRRGPGSRRSPGASPAGERAGADAGRASVKQLALCLLLLAGLIGVASRLPALFGGGPRVTVECRPGVTGSAGRAVAEALKRAGLVDRLVGAAPPLVARETGVLVVRLQVSGADSTDSATIEALGRAAEEVAAGGEGGESVTVEVRDEKGTPKIVVKAKAAPATAPAAAGTTTGRAPAGQQGTTKVSGQGASTSRTVSANGASAPSGAGRPSGRDPGVRPAGAGGSGTVGGGGAGGRGA
ncbi:MAG: hypothetical protein HZA54_14260, partial [Planctomycetes bacterium]|nr:hypothetical protein [Planctomycetota bacterium]